MGMEIQKHVKFWELTFLSISNMITKDVGFLSMKKLIGEKWCQKFFSVANFLFFQKSVKIEKRLENNPFFNKKILSSKFALENFWFFFTFYPQESFHIKGL